ncbi:hypothetical protein LAZ67_11002320, partial [Cordylochernes scorpioides]
MTASLPRDISSSESVLFRGGSNVSVVKKHLGIACVFAAGVVVHRQQILWPGKMAVIDLTVRGDSMTCVNAHISHAAEERCRQLQTIVALAYEEGAWIIGDLNISEESHKNLVSGSVVALLDLLYQADIVDVVTFFDAALEHTRVATIGSRINARRLNRFLLPSDFCDCVTQYQTIDYSYSDPRAVLIQVGDPAPTRLPCIGKLLRLDMFFDRMETFIDEISEDLANLSLSMLWEQCTRINADLAAEIRSLSPADAESVGRNVERTRYLLRRSLEDDTARSDYPSLLNLGRSLRARRRSSSPTTTDQGKSGRGVRSLAPAVADSGGGYIERASYFLRRRLEDDTARSDYPSLSDLGRSLRARRRSPSTFTDDDGNAISGGQLRRFLLERLSSRFTQDPSSEEAIVDFLAEVTPLEFDEWDQLFLSDISRDQIAAVIHRIPNGRASGWDGLPCEFVKAFEDFFAKVLWKVFEASRLRGVLPPSSRRSKGGPGLQAFWPISLPTTDYRVLRGVLMARLRHHLPDLGGLLSSTGKQTPPSGSEMYTPRPSRFSTALRQGCRLSAALLSIGVGPLLRRLERTLGRGNVVAYADDIELFIRDDDHFERVPLIFEELRMSSGVAVNFKKSCGLWCVYWKHRADSPLGISWTSESLTVLGCTITTRNIVASQASHLMGLLERAIARWSPFTRSLSLVGRAHVANSLVLGSILHHLHGYLPPEVTIGRLQTRSSYKAEYEVEAIVLQGSATPITHLTSQRARRALDSARLQAYPTAELTARWTPTVDVPRSIPWADLRRNCFSGQYADVALRLALPHPDSRSFTCAACGSSDGCLSHRYWNCRAVRPLLREVFASCEMPLDLQAWLFGVGLHPEAINITSVTKATIYKYHLGLKLGNASHFIDLPTLWERTLAFHRWRSISRDVIAALRPYCRVVSLAHEVVASGGYTWTTGNREVFILLKDGMKFHQLPAKLVIVSKGESTPAYITYGVRCSKCHRQGHRRATCPLGISGERHQDTRQGPVSRFPFSKPTPFNKSALSTPPAELSVPFKQTPSTISSPAAPASVANFPIHPYETLAPEFPVPAPSTSQLPSRPEPFLTNTEPSAAPAKENQTITVPSIQCTTPVAQILSPSQILQERDRVENMFLELNADSILAPLYNEVVDDDEVLWIQVKGPPAGRSISYFFRSAFIPDPKWEYRHESVVGVLDRLRFLPIKKMDQRTCIKFCVKNEIKCADAFRMLTVAYGEATLDRSIVYRWYKMFSEGREDVNDEERAGRPSTSTTDEKINEVEKMILANRRITVREVTEDLKISIGSCHSIFINDLGMRRVAAKFVPKLLNCDQKQHRMNIANEMLDSVRGDPNLLQRVITGDEAWVYGYGVETKAQSSQWKLPHEPRPKKARQVRSNVKVLLTVFYDCRGVVHHEFLPQSRTVNKEYYLQVMRNLREAIRQKRPDLWKNKNWLLHHDNAPAHTSLLVRDFLAKNNTLMMPQPPYSPDLAP